MVIGNQLNMASADPALEFPRAGSDGGVVDWIGEDVARFIEMLGNYEVCAQDFLHAFCRNWSLKADFHGKGAYHFSRVEHFQNAAGADRQPNLINVESNVGGSEILAVMPCHVFS